MKDNAFQEMTNSMIYIKENFIFQIFLESLQFCFVKQAYFYVTN